MNRVMETVEFYGQRLLVVVDDKGKKWVAIRPICDALGIQTVAQQRKLETDPKFSRCSIASTGADGKTYKMSCVLLSQLNGWLYTINANRVNPSIREKLRVYQQECQSVLYRHFRSHHGSAEDFTGLTKSLSILEDKFDTLQENMHQRFDSLQSEVDELRELIHVTISDDDEMEIRDLIRQVKKEKRLDGRAIVGHVRKTLGTAGVYNTPNLLQVKNVLRNMMGKGVLGLAKEASN